MAESKAWVMIPKSYDKGTEVVIDMRPLVLCMDCKYSEYQYKRFNNEYVCKKNMNKWGMIPEKDLKGHRGEWFCADGEQKESK